MEIWSRLVGGGLPAKKQADVHSPQQRLIRFKKVHDHLQLIWKRNNGSYVKPPEPVSLCLQSAREILQNEVQLPAPHLCARYVSTFRLYTTIAQLAAIHSEEDVIREALDIFNLLLDSEEGDFLKDKGFADVLVGFISTISRKILPIDTEARAVEVLFGVSAKLRLEPELLPTWFRPSARGWALPSGDQRTSMDKFPLFHLTLDYVHHDGKAGDFARTGLLYLIESAAHSASLEQWIIESDLATLMASGLGALYSQLSRKLILDFDKETSPPIISLSEGQRPVTPLDAEKTTSADFKSHLTTFLSYLVFWQDVLEHCSSQDVKEILLDHYKFLFLQQLLYPSLVESSDTDGGSSVAVLTYLKCIIESIDHPDLVQLTFEYLLAVPEPTLEQKLPSRPTALARRRRSQTLLATLAQGHEKPLPDLFNLNDLVIGSLRSRNQQTITATLRLISTMLCSRHHYDVSLIKTGRSDISIKLRPIHAYEENIARLFSIVEDLVYEPGLRESYDTHLQDAQNLLETHACSAHLLALPGGAVHAHSASTGNKNIVHPSTVVPTDPVLASLLSLLEDFLANDIETNLSLTQAFSTMASCAKRSLDGWLLYYHVVEKSADDPASRATGDNITPSDADDTITTSNHLNHVVDKWELCSEQTAETRDRHNKTPVFAALESLVKQVEKFRQEIQDFDIYLLERKRVLTGAEDVDNTANNDTSTKRSSEDSGVNLPPPTKNAPQIGSISERLLSETSTAMGSRSSSPRGRQLDAPSTPTLVGRLSHLHLSPSPSPSKSVTRAISKSPLRKDGASAITSQRLATPISPPDTLSRVIKVKTHHYARKDVPDVRSEASSIRSESTSYEQLDAEHYREVTLSHLLTNIIILQEFVLELAAIVQVRASLFGEIRFE